MRRVIQIVAFIAVSIAPLRGQTASERAATVERLFAEVKSTDDKTRATATAAVARFGSVEIPVLRRELRKAEVGEHRAIHQKTLDALKNKAWERNLRRAEKWGDAGRVDLLVELLATSSGRDPAPAFLPLDKLRQELVTTFGTIRGPTRDTLTVDWPKNAPQLLTANLHSDPEVKLTGPKSTALAGVVVFAERCSIKYKERDSCLFAVRSALEDLAPAAEVSEWMKSTVLVNSSFRAREMLSCLVICDGDFRFSSENVNKISGSLVICNGDFIADERLTAQRVTDSVVYATGNIDLMPGIKRPSNSAFYAGGKFRHVTAANTRAGVTEPPFNVRFLDPKEFGLALEVATGGLKVVKVDEQSPFAKQGLKAGDIVTHADDLPMKTVADFRRELRRGAIDGGLLAHIFRDGKTVPMLFEIPDVPPPPKKK